MHIFNSLYVRIYTIKILVFSYMYDFFFQFTEIYPFKIQLLNTLNNMPPLSKEAF